MFDETEADVATITVEVIDDASSARDLARLWDAAPGPA